MSSSSVVGKWRDRVMLSETSPHPHEVHHRDCEEGMPNIIIKLYLPHLCHHHQSK